MTSPAYYDIASVSTVDFSTATVGGFVGVGTDATNEDGDVIASLSADGLLTYRPSECSVITIETASTIKAIRPLYDDGFTQTTENFEGESGTARKMRPLLLRAVAGGFFTLMHDAAPPVAEWTATERVSTQYGRDVVFGNAFTYVQWAYAGAARRWCCADWGAFVATTPADWTGGVSPDSIWLALDQLAARVAVLEP